MNKLFTCSLCVSGAEFQSSAVFELHMHAPADNLV